MDARKQEVTYWLTLLLIAVGIVAVILFLFRDRLVSRPMEGEEARSRPPELEAVPPGPTATPTTLLPGEEVAAATATATPQEPPRVSAVPTNTPDRRSLRRDAVRLRQMTSEWVYRGYAQMGPRGIGRFSRSKKESETFTASRGDEVDGITVDVLDRTRAVLRLGQATVELLIKPVEIKPTPVPRVRPARRKPPVRPDPRFTEPDEEAPADLVEQETPFEQ